MKVDWKVPDFLTSLGEHNFKKAKKVSANLVNIRPVGLPLEWSTRKRFTLNVPALLANIGLGWKQGTIIEGECLVQSTSFY